jgi:hypothetical protein
MPDDVIGVPENGVAVSWRPDGSAFALSQLDDFEVELELRETAPTS